MLLYEKEPNQNKGRIIMLIELMITIKLHILKVKFVTYQIGYDEYNAERERLWKLLDEEMA